MTPATLSARALNRATLARQHLGWEPKIGLEEGLLKTVEYFKKKI